MNPFLAIVIALGGTRDEALDVISSLDSPVPDSEEQAVEELRAQLERVRAEGLTPEQQLVRAALVQTLEEVRGA